MKQKDNISISDISWLKSSYGNNCSGIIKKYYEPESKEELISLCSELYKNKIYFDLIGCSSNIYFRPDYSTEVLISTRRIRNWTINQNYIYCECGVLVKNLATKLIEEGFQGFEGLVDLPGTVSASIYGNASCFSCSISKLLIDAEVLTESGEIKILSFDDFKFEKRSSAFKRKEIKGVILSARLKAIKSEPSRLINIADYNRMTRKRLQPSPVNNLGSNFSSFEPKLKLRVISALGFIYSRFLKFINVSHIESKRMRLQLFLLGESQLYPYIWDWNRFIWKDERAHCVFDSYVKFYKRCCINANLEIEIKGRQVI